MVAVCSDAEHIPYKTYLILFSKITEIAVLIVNESVILIEATCGKANILLQHQGYTRMSKTCISEPNIVGFGCCPCSSDSVFLAIAPTI